MKASHSRGSAKNSQNHVKLELATENFKASLNAFGRKFLVQDMQDMQKQYGAAYMKKQLSVFLLCKANLDKLIKEAQDSRAHHLLTSH